MEESSQPTIVFTTSDGQETNKNAPLNGIHIAQQPSNNSVKYNGKQGERKM